MRIGILTFHYTHNYGAVLQAFALKKTLKNLGYDCEIINYQSKYCMAPYNIIPSIKRFGLFYFAKSLLNIYPRIKKYIRFKSFIFQNLTKLEKFSNLKNFPKYDYYIVGSDQVWNPIITGGFDKIYWGDFKTLGKKISYAVSCGDVSLIDLNLVYKHILNFDNLSVRENSLKKAIKLKNNIVANLVIDPTLLVDSDIWDNLTKTKIVKKKYILIYQIKGYERIYKIAKEIALIKNLIIVEISAFIRIPKHKYDFVDCSPNDFITLFKNASYILTTSFHGTVFSIIYEKEFIVIQPKHCDNRIYDLLNQLNLLTRINIDDIDRPINFKEVKLALSEMRNESIQFLKKSLNEE